MTLRERILNLLFPPKCPFCGHILDEPGICADCRRNLPWTQGEEQERTLHGNVRCASPLFYEDHARNGILRLKFQGASGAAGCLGELIAACAAEHFSSEFDAVTWVPVSKRRLRQRGYDQARLLAEGACRCWGVKPKSLLRKVTDNHAQSGMQEASARRANVLGVYQADAGLVVGQRLLLVDDVVTTGSTLEECVRTLKDAGAADVVCVTLARTR